MPFRTLGMEIPENVTADEQLPDWYNEQMRPLGRMWRDIPEENQGADPRLQYPGVPWSEQDQLRGPLFQDPNRFMGREMIRENENRPQKIDFKPGDGAQPQEGQLPLPPWEQPKELPGGQGRGMELESTAPDQGGGGEAKPLPKPPWEKEGEVTPPEHDFGEGGYLRDVIPGAKKSLSSRAEEEGVGTEGVDAATRFNAALAYGATGRDLEKQKELFRRAIERDYKKRAEVEYNEKLGQLVYRLEGGDGKWNLVKGAGAGSFFKDLAAAVPELQTAAAEVAFGIPGTVAGTAVAGAPGGVVGGAITASAAGGAGKLLQLLAARNKGLIDLSDDEIFSLALNHAKWTAGGTVAAATLLKIMGTAWRLMTGKPAELLATFKDQGHLMEGKSLADKLKDDAEALAAKGGMRVPPHMRPDGTIATGELHEFPVTAGQQAGIGGGKVIGPDVRPGERYVPPVESDTALAAEKALTRRDVGLPVKTVLDKQSEAINAADFAVFGSRSSEPVADAGRVLKRAINDARAQKAEKFQDERTLLEAGKKINENEIANTGNRTPMAAMADARTKIDDAREALWTPINTAYQGLEKMQTQSVYLEPFRAAARGIERKYGQTLVPEISVTTKGPAGGLLNSAQHAGISENIVNGVTKLSSRAASIAEIETLRKDINYALRQAQKSTTEDADIRARILGELRDGIDASLAQSLPQESMGRILALREAYASMEEQFNKGILSTLTAKTEDGRFVLAGSDAANFLVQSLDNAKAFTDAIRSSNKFVEASGGLAARVVPVTQPEMVQSLRAVQDGILARMRREFFDHDTGKWDSKGMAQWIGERREALNELFRYKGGVNAKTGEMTIRDVGRDNIIDKTYRNNKLLQQTLESQEARAQKSQQLYEKRFGVFTDDPAVLARRLIDDGRVSDLRAAHRLVRTMAGAEGQRTFERGLAQSARDAITDGKGMIRPEKIDEFMLSARGKALQNVLGDEWAANVRTVGDMVKVRELEASGMASQEIAEVIGRSVPGLRSIARFARVLFPPWSPRGRGLTAALGMMNERSQKQMGELLADPEALSQLISLSKKGTSPYTKSNRVQLTRLGFAHLGDIASVLSSFDDSIMENFSVRPEFDERAGKTIYDTMGQGAPLPDEPLKFNDRPPRPEDAGRLQGGGMMEPTPGDMLGPQGGRPTDRSSGSMIEGGPRRPPGLRLGEGGTQGLTNMPEETAIPKTSGGVRVPPSFQGAMDTLAPHFQMKGPGDPGYNPRESGNAEMRANERGWLTPEQQQTTEFPKGVHGRGFMMPLDEPSGEQMAGAAKVGLSRQQARQDTEEAYGRDIFRRLAPDAVRNANETIDDLKTAIARYPDRWRERLGMFEGAEGKMGDHSPEAKIADSQERVLVALENDPATTMERGIKPIVTKMITAVGGVASRVGSHLMDTMDAALHGSGDEQHKAATELALIVTGLGYSRFPLTGARGSAELGMGGGRLPPVEPPRRVAANENMRDRLSTVEGGESIVPREIDLLSKKLSRSLEDARDTMKSGKGSIPTKVDRVRGHIQELEKASDSLMREAESLAPPLGKQQYKDLKSMGMTEHEYRLQQLYETNAEIDAGKREAFQLMATGRDVKMEITPQNIKDWLEAAGVKDVTIVKSNLSGSNSQYVKFPDPVSSGKGKTQVRVSDHRAVQRPGGADTLDASGINPRAGQMGRSTTENVTGGNFSEWENLVDALKWRLAKSPDGQWLISPGQEPLARSFGRARRAMPAESAREPTISRDPNQLELPLENTGSYRPVAPEPRSRLLDEGRTPFDRLPRNES